MTKIAKVDAFNAVAEAMNENDIATANEIMKIISRSISKERKNKTTSDIITLNSKKEEKYFKNVVLIKEQEN